jgi:hypothetical protein
MQNTLNTLPFPSKKPEEYIALENEPVFSANKHLALEDPKSIVSLSDLGYGESEIADSPSNFGVCSAFRILSDEGVEVMRDLCRRMYSNRNATVGTGANRLGSYIRGAGYRSQFVKDFCDSPELAKHLSSLTGVSLARHSVPAVACGINYAPDDISKAVDTWHTDSVAFDIVMLMSNPDEFAGGEFQYFDGTKHEGQQLLGIDGEEGVDSELPSERVMTVTFPKAGYGFLQQGNQIFHRARQLTYKAERITMIPSFVVTPSTANDATNSVNMAAWEDPGIVPELARHEAWRASARLAQLIDDIDVTETATDLKERLDAALAPLEQFRAQLVSSSKLALPKNEND